MQFSLFFPPVCFFFFLFPAVAGLLDFIPRTLSYNSARGGVVGGEERKGSGAQYDILSLSPTSVPGPMK